MKIKKSLTAATVLQAIVLGGALGSSLVGMNVKVAHAQAATIAIGVVDEDKLAEGYKAYRDAAARIDQKVQDLDAQLAARELLNTQDGAAFDTLISKERSVAENAQLKALVDRGTANRAEYTGLIAKETKSEGEKGRIKTLEEMARNNAPKLRAKSDEMYSNIKKEQEDNDKKYIDQANNVIAQVAGDKKIAVVVRQRAVIWSDPKADITDEVLARLNK